MVFKIWTMDPLSTTRHIDQICHHLIAHGCNRVEMLEFRVLHLVIILYNWYKWLDVTGAKIMYALEFSNSSQSYYHLTLTSHSAVQLRFPPLGPVLLDPGPGCRCPIHILQPTKNTTKTSDSLDHWIIIDCILWQFDKYQQYDRNIISMSIFTYMYTHYHIILYVNDMYDSYWFMIFMDWNIQVHWRIWWPTKPTLTFIFKPRARFNATLNSSKGVTSSKSVSKTCKTPQRWWDFLRFLRPLACSQISAMFGVLDTGKKHTCTYQCLHVYHW